MKNLSTIRSLIREMLSEAMKTPEANSHEIPGFRVDVDTKKPDEITILISQEEYNEIQEKDIRFVLSTLVAKKKQRTPKAPCLDAWEVAWANSKAAPGWGPFLYHLMMQVVEQKGGSGIMADRTEVSKDALSVWQKFSDGVSPDTVKLPLDDPWNTLTDYYEDNCSQFSSRTNFPEFNFNDDEERAEALRMSPIAKVYRRKAGARDWRGELIEMGVYYENGVPVGEWDAD